MNDAILDVVAVVCAPFPCLLRIGRGDHLFLSYVGYDDEDPPPEQLIRPCDKSDMVNFYPSQEQKCGYIIYFCNRQLSIKRHTSLVEDVGGRHKHREGDNNSQ